MCMISCYSKQQSLWVWCHDSQNSPLMTTTLAYHLARCVGSSKVHRVLHLGVASSCEQWWIHTVAIVRNQLQLRRWTVHTWRDQTIGAVFFRLCSYYALTHQSDAGYIMASILNLMPVQSPGSLYFATDNQCSSKPWLAWMFTCFQTEYHLSRHVRIGPSARPAGFWETGSQMHVLQSFLVCGHRQKMTSWELEKILWSTFFCILFVTNSSKSHFW